MIARRLTCAAVGAVLGIVLAMCMAVAYARPAPSLVGNDRPEPGMPTGIPDAASFVLLTSDEGIWTVSPDQVDYARLGEHRLSLNIRGTGFGAAKSVAVDPYDGSLWILSSRNLLFRIDVSGAIHPIVGEITDAAAVAVGLGGGAWVATSDELLYFNGDGTLNRRATLPANTGARRMIVDSLRGAVVVAFAGKVIIVADETSRAGALTEIVPGDNVRSIDIDPLTGELWVLLPDRIQRYSAAGLFIDGIDLRASAPNAGDFATIAYDGELDLLIAASATTSMAFDREGRWSTAIDVSAIGPSVRPPPLRLHPTVDAIVGETDENVDVRVGARCNRKPCDSGAAYLQGIQVFASLDGAPLAADRFLWSGSRAAAFQGNGTLSLQAVDLFGHASEPATLTLTGTGTPVTLKANQAPAVTMTAPPNNGTFVPGSNITLSATASDSDGTVKKVEFFRSSTLIGTSVSSPWSFIWTSVPAGNYTLTAKATDDKGASKTSSNVSISVKAPPNVAPSISINSPLAGSTVNGPVLTITTSVKDTDGTVSRVDFYEGTKLLGTINGGAPTLDASWNYRDVAAGAHTIKAVATDNSGASTSASVTFNVNAAPFAVLTSPAPCSEIIFPGDIVLTADAHDPDGTVSRVDFYRGTTLLGSVTSPPYRYTWKMAPVGDYTFTATAIDRQGATGSSNAVSTAVRVPDVPPIVSMATPASGSRFGVGAPIPVSALASDADGTIRKVEFYAGTVLIGSAAAAPYSIVWRPTSTGTTTLTAKATDDRGVATNSQPVSITIVNNVPPSAWLEVPGNSAILAVGESIDLVTRVSDADGVVRKVEYLIGKPYEVPSRSLGTVNAAPFRFRFTMDVAGARYWVVARATDDLGSTSDSQSVWLVGNTAPSVTITSPAEGTVFLPGSKINIAGTASDPEGNFYLGIAEAWVNGRMRWRGSRSFYNTDTGQLTLDSFPFDPGLDVTLVVRGIDTKGAESYSTPAHFRTAPLPLVEILTPEPGKTIPVSSPIKLTARASQPLGTIVRVNYYSGGNVIGTSTTAPYEITWTPPFNGSTTDVSVRAEAIDNLGTGGVGASEILPLLVEPLRLAITSPTHSQLLNEDSVRVTGTYADGFPTSITVNGVPATFGNGAYEAVVMLRMGPFGVPLVNPYAKSITVVAATPRGNAVREVSVVRIDGDIVVHLSFPNGFVAPASVDVSADTNHFAPPITKVEYLMNNTVIGTAFAPPWRAGLTVAKAGNYFVNARATDENGKTYLAPGEGFGVSYGIGAHITSPSDGQSFSQGSRLDVIATMRPSPGQKITRFELLMDNAVVSSEAGIWDNLEWRFGLLGVPLGQHTFAVRFRDSSGASIVSGSMRASVVPGPVLTLLTPRDGTTYRSGGAMTLVSKVVLANYPIPYVDFFANGMQIARVSDPPYIFKWEGMAPGTYELTASTRYGETLFSAPPVSIVVADVALNIERPSDQEIVYDPWVVVGGNYDAADSPQSILVNGVPAKWANGMFSARVPLPMGNNVVTVAAAFRTQNVHTSVVVNRANPTITFANVTDGDVVFNDTVSIRGVVHGPRNSGLLVNGLLASKSAAGDFFINAVPLNPGVNRLVFQLVKQDDSVVEWPLTVTRDGTKPFVVSVTPITAYSLPLQSLLTVRMRAPVDYTTLQLLDRGNVVFEEAVTRNKRERAYQLETRDFVSTDLAIRLLDSTGHEVFREPVFTRVSRPEELDAEIRSFFRETVHRVAAGDLSGGAASYLPQLQQDFKMMYEDLGNEVPSLMEMMRDIGAIAFSEQSAEVTLHRREQDGLRGYPVGLMRDSKGIWRISGM